MKKIKKNLKSTDIIKVSHNKNESEMSITNFRDEVRTYKVYRAIINQTGTNPPVATVLENTLGINPTYAYVGAGQYTLTSVGSFPVDKTVLECYRGYWDLLVTTVAADYRMSVSIFDDDTVWIYTTLDTTSTDGIMNPSFYSRGWWIEIKVYE